MWTVYFDTSFFINLRDAADDEASAAIHDLNRLQVRHVFSDVLFRELILSTVPQEAWFRLVGRVSKFEQAPLILGPANWLALLAPDPDRQRYAQAFRNIDDQLSAGKSMSLAAGRKLDKEQVDKLLRSDPNLMASMGWLKQDGSIDLSAMEAWGRTILKDVLGVDPTVCAPAQIAGIVDKKLRDTLGDAVVDKVKEHDRLTESALVGSERPVRHATRELSDGATRELSTTYRDTEHMALFVQNSSAINLLQIDSKQMNLALASRTHRLQVLGLLERCFVARSLSEVVPRLEGKLRARGCGPDGEKQPGVAGQAIDP